MHQGFEGSNNAHRGQSTQKMFVAVAGNIGSGKATSSSSGISAAATG